MKIKESPIFIPVLISTVMLLLAIPTGWPYGYYTLLRFVVCGTAAFIAYTAYTLKKRVWIWTTGLIAILFNPLIPVHLDKETWVVIDVIVAVLFAISIFKVNPLKEKER